MTEKQRFILELLSINDYLKSTLTILENLQDLSITELHIKKLMLLIEEAINNFSINEERK